MSWTDLMLRLRALRSPRRAESELDEELQFHLEMEARKLGTKNAARRAFGGVEQVREQCRDARGISAVENLARDVRYGVRMLAKAPVFTAVAILSLAIGIGANTAVFTLVDAVLLKTLPVRHPEQLVALQWGTKHEIDIARGWANNTQDKQGRDITNVVTWRIFDDLRRNTRTMQPVIGFSSIYQASVATRREAMVTDGMIVSGEFFPALGVRAAAGRLLTADDDTANGEAAAVLSYRLWQTMFAGNPEAIGSTMYINGAPCSIVGVMDKDFLGLNPPRRADFVLPIRARDRFQGAAKQRIDWFGDWFFWVQMVGRRNAGVSPAAVEAELAAAIAPRLPEAAQRSLAGEMPYALADPAAQGLSWMREYYRKPLLIILAVVALTLLMACANLAGLLLARAHARGREIMVRLALGAKRARLVRQLLVEGALLSFAGAAAGLAVAQTGLQALLWLMSSGRSDLEAAIDWRVLAFTAAVSIATTLLFALAPALRATRVDVAHGLKEETPAISGRRFGAVRVLVAVQIAVALPLVAGAMLLGRTLANLRSLDYGFNTGNLVLFDLRPEQSGYDEMRSGGLYRRILEKLQQTPGVAGVTMSSVRPLGGRATNAAVRLIGRPRPARSHFQWVAPDFFRVMQLPLVAGRAIETRDMSGPAVALVNETFVRRYMKQGSPLGRRFRWERDDSGDVEIVGVVKDAKYDRIRTEIPPTVYAPYTQTAWGWPAQMTVEARTAGDAATAVAAIRRAMAEIDRGLPLIDLKTQRAQVDDLLSQERLFAWLVGLFGAIALALASVGLYGLVTASVAGRTREIGVRMALGAGRAAVLRIVLGHVAATAGAGIAVGLGATWAATKVIKAMLYGVTEHDRALLAIAGAGVLAVAILTAAWPARRATRIDPVQALRYE